MTSPAGSPGRPRSLPPLSALAAMSLDESPPVPLLPLEVTRRILAHALELPPLFPSPADDPVPTPAWDEFVDRGAAIAGLRRIAQGREAAACALRLMRVCKAWKSICTKYLYAEPYLRANWPGFVGVLIAGERKWSDLNLHPVATPGRWVRTLDLSRINVATETKWVAACAAVFPLVPGLEHLKIAPWHSTMELPIAPFLRRLKSLRGVFVRGAAESSRLLRHARALEVLELLCASTDLPDDDADPLSPPLDMPHLHTLSLDDHSRQVQDVLARSYLPRLERLVIFTHDGHIGSLCRSHGPQIRSLAMFTFEHSDITAELLRCFPAIEHLHIATYSPSASALHTAPDLVSIFADRAALPWPRLHTLTVPAWIRHAPEGESTDSALLAHLADRPPPALRVVAVVGFKWLPAALGARALATGESGVMRAWAARLRRVGIELRDENGALAQPEPVDDARWRQRRKSRG